MDIWEKLYQKAAERIAALNMYINSGQTVIIAFRDAPPHKAGSGMPCGACQEFLMHLPPKNRAMEILVDVDYETRETVTLDRLIPQ